MGIARKIALSFIIVAATVLGLLITFQRPQLIANFERLQTDKGTRDAERAGEVVRDEIERLNRDVQDWSSWDDSYVYVKDGNHAYEVSNLRDSVFEISNIDFVWVIDLESRLVGGAARRPDGVRQMELPGAEFSTFTLTADGKSMDFSVRNGIREVCGVPTIFAVRPILDSNEEMDPRGIMVMGRYISNSIRSDYEKATKVPLKFIPYEKVKSDESLQEVLTAVQDWETWVERPEQESKMYGYSLLSDEKGGPTYLLRSETTTELLQEGIHTVNSSYKTMVYVVIVGVMIGLLIISATVSNPIKALAANVQQIDPEDGGALNPSLVERTDEIGVLARNFHDLLQKLETAKTRLMRASRNAGMADVAREMLHNAGNLLNTLATSVNVVDGHAKSKRYEGIRKSVLAIRENEAQLGAFFDEKAKGRQILDYLEALASEIEREQSSLALEAHSLAKTTDYLEQIVKQQEQLASSRDQHAVFNLSVLVNDLKEIMASSLETHKVESTYSVSDSVVCFGNPGKLLQVLVNLMTNAKDSVKQVSTGPRKITLDATPNGEFVEIRIKDSGLGIAEHDLANIFRQGFTTKHHGMGIGLHFSANAAKELGGDLHAESQGPGTGAVFILKVRRYKGEERAA